MQDKIQGVRDKSVTKNFTWLEPDEFVPTFASSQNLILQKVGDSVTF